jgi:hypothetical protein
MKIPWNHFKHLIFAALIPLLASSCGSNLAPKILSFTATPNALTATGDVKLEWQVENATEVSISPDIGAVSGTTTTVNITANKTFTLTAKSSAGTDTRNLEVLLNSPITPGSYVQIAAPSPTQPNKIATIPVELADGYGLYQGDILFDPADIQNSTTPKRDTRGNRLEPGYCENGTWFWKYNCHDLWDAKTLQYEFAPGVPLALQQVVLDAAAVFKERAGINFVYSTVGDRVVVKTIPANDPRGGASFVGRLGGAQDIVFQADAQLPTVLHEFGHALGLWHEQGRADRNSYIRLLENNILIEQLSQYRLIDDPDIGHPDGPYDFYSIMHYRAFGSSFAKKDAAGVSLQTFELVNPNSGIDLTKVGNATELSPGDVLAVANLYDAPVTAGSIQLLKSGSSKLINGGQTSVNIRVQNDGPRVIKDLYFSISAPSGISLSNANNNLKCDNASLNQMSCYAPSGPAVNTSGIFGPINVGVSPNLPTGKYEIVLELNPRGTRLADKTKAVSKLKIENLRIDPDFLEGNNTFQTASAALAPDDINLSLHTPSDSDYFLIDASGVTNTLNYEVSASNIDGGSKPNLEIFDINKNPLSVTTTKEGQYADITNPGKYYVKVSGDQIMRYNFVVSPYDPLIKSLLGKIFESYAPLVFNPGGPIEKSLIFDADYFQVSSAVRQVVLQGANVKVGIYNQNLELRAQSVLATDGISRMNVPSAAAGEFLFMKLERIQDEVVVDNLTIQKPLQTYSIRSCNTRAAQCNADTTLPSISLSSNTPGPILSAQVLQLTADAQDNDAVKTVEFYENDILIGTDETAPYKQNISFSSLHNGTRSYTARAIDFAGLDAKTPVLKIGADITNNIFNPGAELGAGASAASPAVSSIPGWTASNAATVVKYDSEFFVPSNIAQAIGGENNFFAGGTQDNSSLEQVIDLANGSSAVDTGKVAFTLSAYLGGNGSQEDNAKVSITFLDSSGAVIPSDPTSPSPQVGPVAPNDRDASSILVQRTTSGFVPINTRAVRVTINMTKLSSDTSNDGYADNINLNLYAP